MEEAPALPVPQGKMSAAPSLKRLKVRGTNQGETMSEFLYLYRNEAPLQVTAGTLAGANAEHHAEMDGVDEGAGRKGPS